MSESQLQSETPDMRGTDGHGNVRPADARYLPEPVKAKAKKGGEK